MSSSGQWEIVGNRKKEKSNTSKAKPATMSAKEQQKSLLNGLKVEQVLPMSQLKNLYASKSTTATDNKKTKDASKKDQQQQQKAAPKKQQDFNSKAKTYKSIDIAYNSIKPEDLNGVYENNKVVYPTTPIVWLRELAQYLNVHLNVDVSDVAFTNKPDNYPLCAMPGALRATLEKGLKQAGADNCALFFDISLTSMANDMNKNLPCLGHKVFLQLMAASQPKLCAGNLSKYNVLVKSYQNRPNIGISILWALGQGGFKDLSVGIQAFQDFMFPLIDMKNYTRFVIKYLINILRKHSSQSSSSSSSALTPRDYLYVIDIIYGNRKNMSHDLAKELFATTACANELALRNDNLACCIEPLLGKLGQVASKACKLNLNNVLHKCLQADTPKCLSMWQTVYENNLPASVLLLQHLDQTWRSNCIDVKELEHFLNSLTIINQRQSGAGAAETDNVKESVATIRRLKSKMASSNKGKSHSKCRYLLYTTCALISALVYLDVRQSGGWNNSCTLRALNKTGVCAYTHKAYDRASECTQWVHSHIEDQFPGITESTIQYTTPYIELGRDVSIIARNLVNNAREAIESRIPYITQTIETYVPGLIGHTQQLASDGWAVVSNGYDNCREYLATNVFVGKLAPEEMRRTVLLFVDGSVDKVQEYYAWLSAKIANAMK